MSVIPLKPTSAEARKRWEVTSARRRMLEGDWGPDLEARIKAKIGTVRSKGWGGYDMGSNLLSSVCGQLSTLYDSQPIVRHAAPGGLDLAAAVALGGHWEQMQRVQRDTLGLREYFVRVDADKGVLNYRPVPPDLVEAEAPLWDHAQPNVYREARNDRVHPQTGEAMWTWDSFDISGDTPRFQILDKDGLDISAAFGNPAGGVAGEAYLKEWSLPATKAPLIPVVAYHAQRTGKLFAYRDWHELVEATLTSGVYWSYFGHVLLDASHPQRYAIGVEAPAAENDGERSEYVADPAVVIILKRGEGEGQPVIGQWQAGCDPDVLVNALTVYERRAASFAGISESDFARISGDPRSGYALTIKEEAGRKAAKRFEPTFSRSDKRLLTISGAVLGAAVGKPGAFPVGGFGITYPGPPMSTAEMLAEIKQLQDIGMIHPAAAYQRLHPHLTREQAQSDMEEIARARRALDVSMEPPRPAEPKGDGDDPAAKGSDDPAEGSGGTLLVGNVSNASAIVADVAAGKIPRDSGVQMLIDLIGLEKAVAERVMGTVGKTFKPAGSEAA